VFPAVAASSPCRVKIQDLMLNRQRYIYMMKAQAHGIDDHVPDEINDAKGEQVPNHVVKKCNLEMDDAFTEDERQC
ncbi:hypothetical protein Tco_1563716, partial [Tanacetum coccineum]